ncbi:hypothetical protein [Wolbachia endosymbiont (group A) of Colletes cunicularius]|uniref:hypothetical protein n=1 Tax=Wolbachia endosymbiont (group A) of Colletes cunicularius TaxID=3139321 RepID=UPI0035C9423F
MTTRAVNKPAEETIKTMPVDIAPTAIAIPASAAAVLKAPQSGLEARLKLPVELNLLTNSVLSVLLTPSASTGYESKKSIFSKNIAINSNDSLVLNIFYLLIKYRQPYFWVVPNFI